MDAPTVDIVFTMDELWPIVDYVREHQAHGREWSKGTMRAFQEALLNAIDSPEHKATVTLDAADCWQITRQIPSGLMVGTQNLGRILLIQAFLGLRELEPVGAVTEPGEIAVPSIFSGAWEADEEVV